MAAAAAAGAARARQASRRAQAPLQPTRDPALSSPVCSSIRPSSGVGEDKTFPGLSESPMHRHRPNPGPRSRPRSLVALGARDAPPAPSPACWNRPGTRSTSASPTPATPASSANSAPPVGHHPPVIESFRTWGSDFPDSIQRWQTARARPMIHITTADSHDGHELISPAGIALGGGDEYLVRLNKLFWPSTCAPTSGRSASPTAASTSTPPTTAPATCATPATRRAGTGSPSAAST